MSSRGAAGVVVRREGLRFLRAALAGQSSGQLARPEEDGVEHGRLEDAGEGVLVGGVVAAEKDRTGGRSVLGAVGELGLGAHHVVQTQRGVPGEGAEADDYFDGEQGELADGVG